MAAIMIFVGSELDTFTLLGGIGIILFLAYKSFICFRGGAPPTIEDLGKKPSEDASVAEHIAFHKRLIFIGGPILLFLSFWIIYNLNKLESGEVASVSIWSPIATLYETIGYWPAVLIIPALGLFVVLGNVKKINEIKNGQQKV